MMKYMGFAFLKVLKFIINNADQIFQHGRISYHINGGLLYTDTSQFGSYVNSTKVMFCTFQ